MSLTDYPDLPFLFRDGSIPLFRLYPRVDKRLGRFPRPLFLFAEGQASGQRCHAYKVPSHLLTSGSTAMVTERSAGSMRETVTISLMSI